MCSDFDPYRVWLSIPVSEQPANYYRLLGVELFESDEEVISSAADRQMSHVRTFQSGQYSELSQKILNELSAARVTLLSKKKKIKYDSKLRFKLNASSEAKIDDTIVVELPPPPPPSLAPSKPKIQPKFEVKTFIKNNLSKGLIPYIVILLSAMVLELFLFLFYQSCQPTTDGLILSKAKRLYNQSVELENEEKYAEAQYKMIAACELEPENEEYKTRERRLRELENERKAKEKYNQSIELEANRKYGEAMFIINEVCELVPENKDYDSARQRIKKRYEASQLVAGDRKTFTVDGVEFAFRYCPPDTFMMGAYILEKGRKSSERLHQVTLTKGFWMMETEVTVGMFKAFVNDTGYEPLKTCPDDDITLNHLKAFNYSWRNPPLFEQDDNHPVTLINWNDAVEFCKWLSKKTGQEITLPTEAQWEYACRTGSIEAYSGSLDEMAWYASNSEDKTHPVGTKKPNAWGLYDMYGNVCEWCQDWYGDYHGLSVTDPTGPSSGFARIVRGGSCSSSGELCRSACRNLTAPRLCDEFLGFRCAMSITSPEN